MNTRQWAILANAAVLAVLVLAGLAAVLLAQPPEGPLVALYAVLAGVSVLSVPVVYLLKIRPRRSEALLRDDFARRFALIRDSIAASNLAAGTKREIAGDCLELLLSAQQGGRSAEDAIPDPVAFAEDILDAYGRRSLRAWQAVPRGLLYLVFFVLGTQTLLWLEDTQQSWFAVPIDLGMFLFFVLIAFVLVPILRLPRLQGRIWLYSLPVLTGLLFIGFAELMRWLAPDSGFVRLVLDGAAGFVPTPGALMAWLGAIPLLLLVRWAFLRPAVPGLWNRGSRTDRKETR